MTLEEFLGLENPEEYDFKDSMIEYYEYWNKNGKPYSKLIVDIKEQINEERNNIKKFFAYKTLDREFTREDGREFLFFDCDNGDRCNLTKEIYSKLWMQNNNFSGDTMNSFATTIIQYVDENRYLPSEDKLSIMKIRKLYSDNWKLSNAWIEFAKMTDSIGNFTLVPKHFNMYRYNKTRDYWDLSLCLLKSDCNIWGEIIWKSEDLKNYINQFFLWDYIGEDLTPISLFESHKAIIKRDSWSKEDIMPKGEEFKEFLSKVNNLIRQRGIFMVAMLKIATENEEDYKNIAEYLKGLEECFQSCEDAAEKLKTECKLSNKSIDILDETTEKLKQKNIMV